MSAVSFMKLVGVLAFLAGPSVAVTSVDRPGPQYYQKFETMPSAADTATELVTKSLHIPLSHVDKRQAPRIEDIVVVLGGGWSVGWCEFEIGKKALKNMMDAVTTDTKYAAVTFGTSARVNFNFLTNPPAGNRLLQIPHPSGWSNTQAGLAEAKKLFENPLSGRRVYSTKIVLLVTDGLSSFDGHLIIPNADSLKNIGVKIFVVAVGTYTSTHRIDEMVKIASDPPEDHVFRVKSHSGFYDVVKLAFRKVRVAPDQYRVVAGQYEQHRPCYYGNSG